MVSMMVNYPMASWWDLGPDMLQWVNSKNSDSDQLGPPLEAIRMCA